MISEDEVLGFIRNFAGSERVFLEGMCYWFAFILKTRFGGEIFYDPVQGHFITKINGRFYDVRGDVTEGYAGCAVYPWDSYCLDDPKHRERIVQDCILKVKRRLDVDGEFYT